MSSRLLIHSVSIRYSAQFTLAAIMAVGPTKTLSHDNSTRACPTCKRAQPTSPRLQLLSSAFLSPPFFAFASPSWYRYFTKDSLCVLSWPACLPSLHLWRPPRVLPAYSHPWPTLPHSRPSCANSTPVLLLKVMANWTSGNPRGCSLSCLKLVVQI